MAKPKLKPKLKPVETEAAEVVCRVCGNKTSEELCPVDGHPPTPPESEDES